MYKIRFTRLLLLAVLIAAIPCVSVGQILFSVTVAPPPLPVYVQPVCPEAGYMWTPGYWAFDDDYGYYWVPGTWVPAPEPGLLWTPGYWGWDEGVFVFHQGYWAPHVGYYGGVYYGYGYNGEGFGGGEWRSGRFFYNTAVMHVDRAHITNVYVDRRVIVNRTNVNRVSYNGGVGGTRAAPTPADRQIAEERHIEPTPVQIQNRTAAVKNPQLLLRNNGGRPAIAATAKPGDFSPKSIVPANAAGGRVNPASLKATAKTMPPPPKTAPAEGKNEPGAKAPAVGPRGTSPDTSERNTRNAGGERLAPAPHAAAPAERPAPHAAAPAERPAPHAAAPAERPAPHAAAPAERPAPHAAAPAERPAPHAAAPAERPAPHAAAPAERPAPHAAAPAERPAPHAAPAPRPSAKPKEEKPKDDKEKH